MTQFKRNCSDPDMASIRDVMDRFGDRRSILVLCVLAEDGASRFNALRHRIEDISQPVLAQTIRGLEQDGLLSCSVYPTNPPGVQYALTPLGRSALERVWEMVRWARKNRRRALEARKNSETPAGPKAQAPRDAGE